MTILETRSKASEANVKKLEMQLQSYMVETNKKLEFNDSKMDDLSRKMDVMMEKLFASKDEILGSPPMGAHHAEGYSSRSRAVEILENSNGRFYANISSSRIDCPYFEEGDPRSWLRKYKRYFHYNHINDPQHKLETTVLHLNGRAESWYFSYQVSKRIVRWPDVVEEMCKRFNNSVNSNLNLLWKFKRIEQIGTVNEYLKNLRI